MSGSAGTFWPDAGLDTLRRDRRGWLVPTDDYLRRLFGRPELALVEESCEAERRLRRSLFDDPQRVVDEAELNALADADAQQSYRVMLRLRDLLSAAGTLEQTYLDLVTDNSRTLIPPPLIDDLARSVTAALLTRLDADGYMLRAAELFFRPQQVGLDQGVALVDAERLARRQPPPLRLLQSLIGQADMVASAPADRRAELPALNRQTLDDYRRAAREAGYAGSDYVLGFNIDEPGLAAFCRLLEAWARHFLDVPVRIEPRREISDPRWRWHIGLDADASALLDTLYRNGELDDDQRRRLLLLFELRFERAAQMRAELRGAPVYLGLAMNNEQRLRLKPQNLLLNLPLRRGRC